MFDITKELYVYNQHLQYIKTKYTLINRTGMKL